MLQNVILVYHYPTFWTDQLWSLLESNLLLEASMILKKVFLDLFVDVRSKGRDLDPFSKLDYVRNLLRF